jgi:carboxyl-terminal processing protease
MGTTTSAQRAILFHSTSLAGWLPIDWRPAPDHGLADWPRTDLAFVGPGGVVWSDPVRETVGSLDEAASVESAPPRYGGSPSIQAGRLGELDVRLIAPSDDQMGRDRIDGVVVQLPAPFTAFDGRAIHHVVVRGSHPHLESIVGSLTYAADAVSPMHYLDGVFDLMAAQALRGQAVDWLQLRTRTRAGARQARSPRDTYPQILAAIEALGDAGDNHTFFATPAEVAGTARGRLHGLGLIPASARDLVVAIVFPDGPAAEAGVRVGDRIVAVDDQVGLPFPAWWHRSRVRLALDRPEGGPREVTIEARSIDGFFAPHGRRIAGDVGYLELVGVSGPAEIWRRYAAAVEAAIAACNPESIRAWIVDLRRNMGGAYFPMVVGMGSLLGDGPFFGYQATSGRLTLAELQSGRLTHDGEEIFRYSASPPAWTASGPALPVAILTGPLTASSGEVAALAFAGLPRSRRFGRPTAGKTTVNGTFRLVDGAELYLACGEMTDRFGRTYPDGLTPDEVAATDWTRFGALDDPVVAAALAWFEALGSA